MLLPSRFIRGISGPEATPTRHFAKIGLILIAMSCSATLLVSCATTPNSPNPAAAQPDKSAAGSVLSGLNVGRRVLFYLPDRVFDLVDIVRARVRVGPGYAFGAQATRPASVFIGSYATVFAGLPGPRAKMTIPIPAGVETRTGVAASVADATLEGGLGPDYSPTEFGLSLQVVLLGLDVTLDPVEFLDFIVGIFGFDLRGDDF